MSESRYETSSAEETIAVGRAWAAALKPPLLLILRGDLGAGKTTLVKGIAEGLGVGDAEEVTSPTFTLVHEYEGERIKLYHLDVYRLEEERQLAALGIEEMIESDSIVLIEWGEKFASLAARADGEILLTNAGADHRCIILQLRNR
jgi:tRNA threonylcarbamoyladenosine biosynthesis protein TsaE